MKKNIIFFLAIVMVGNLYGNSFNKNLSEEEIKQLESSELLIRNINFSKNICLNEGICAESDELIKEFNKLSPKYLAEVIEYKPYKGNEDLPKKLETLLNNVSDYAGIPYWSVQKQKFYDLYKSAKIINTTHQNNKTILDTEFVMEPFDVVEEEIVVTVSNDTVLYVATNQNKLRYLDKFDCIWPQKMKIGILLFRDGDNWVLYGIGGVNAPRIPMFTERIQTSFINRINTFCSYMFKQI
ncbi:MAG: hypothetical protein MJ188_01950 [Treponema sp.]|nr:hypothetical protein [Treponema sp.]